MPSSIKLTRSLIDVAMGRAHADLVIRKGQWVCVQSGEIIPDTDIAIKDGHIAYVGADAKHTIGKGTRVIEAKGRYLVPGLLDGHMHVESGMVTVTEFVRAVAVRGTTGMFIDPHEIANVFGLKGVKLMADEAAEQPIHVWVQMPSCVPSSPGFETPGASIDPADVAEAMTWPNIIGQGHWRALSFAGFGPAFSCLRGRRPGRRSRRHARGRCSCASPPGHEGHAALRFGLAGCGNAGQGHH